MLGQGAGEVEVLAPADVPGPKGVLVGGLDADTLNTQIAHGDRVTLPDLIAVADAIEEIDGTIYLLKLDPRIHIAELESDDRSWIVKTRARRAADLSSGFSGTTPLPLRPNMVPSRFCCNDMKTTLERQCNVHWAIWDCPDNPLAYAGAGNYGIIAHDGQATMYFINFCPWCGQHLAEFQ